MKYRTQVDYTAEEKSEMWDRWQRGESINSIGRNDGLKHYRASHSDKAAWDRAHRGTNAQVTLVT